LAHVIKDLWTAVNFCFYDRSDYDVCSVVVWAEIPDVIENKKVYSQVTTDKEHKKLMKVLYPKKQQTNNVKKTIIATACTNYAKLLRIIEIRQT
jgi:hypothetical protein